MTHDKKETETGHQRQPATVADNIETDFHLPELPARPIGANRWGAISATSQTPVTQTRDTRLGVTRLTLIGNGRITKGLAYIPPSRRG
jgi:hypothetical protein